MLMLPPLIRQLTPKLLSSEEKTTFYIKTLVQVTILVLGYFPFGQAACYTISFLQGVQTLLLTVRGQVEDS